MNKSIIAAILMLIVLGVGVYYFASQPSEYEIVFADEVSEIESELAALDAQIAAGELSPEEALVARASIIQKLNRIETNAAGAGSARLTETQKQQLADGLDRLKRVLVRYQDTLITVDNTARKASGTVIRRSERSLQSVFVEVIAEAETSVIEAEVEVVTEPSLDTELEEIETTMPETIEEVIEEVEESTESADESHESEVTDADETTTDSTDESTAESEASDEPDETFEAEATTTVEADTSI